jgi:tRNA A-37 threonylcarbamoyl transferase component Bud32/TolB-like protein
MTADRVLDRLAAAMADRYTIEHELGRGGTATVYLAHDRKHNRRVALKVLRPELAAALGPERFLREIAIDAPLNHPHILPLLDSGEAGGLLYYVMPYVEGESLRDRLAREKQLPIEDVLRITREVADGLSYAHSHGVVHRDIKPGNILLQSGHAVIADFGAARALTVAADEPLTDEGMAVGTPAYMSPEQGSGVPEVDARSDVYSLACVVYEMLAGEPPFTGFSAQAVVAKRLSSHPPPISILRDTVPAHVERALAVALARMPADRFATAKEFADALTRPHEPARPRWRRGIAAAVLVAILVGVSWWWIHVTHGRRREPLGNGRQRVVVGLFENLTGDRRYDALGFMAADWVTEGFQRTGAIDVVPTPTALAAARYLQKSDGTGDPVRSLARETGANLVVTGSIYQEDGTLTLQAQLADADSGRLVGAVEPIRTSAARSVGALQDLRARLMGLLSLSLDARVVQGERAPTYSAYQAFSEGMDAYVRNDWAPALIAFERANNVDTTFVLPLLYASFCYVNRRAYAAADSVLRIVASQRSRLNPYDTFWLDYQRAELAANNNEALAAIRQAAELAPTSKATYNFADRAFEARQPFAAESALERLSPDVGPMRGWFPYWDVLASALHAQGKYGLELKIAREARQRFPDRIDAYNMEARALAAEHQSSELERLWLEAAGNTKATPLEIGSLAYETGSEVWTHGDSGWARPWFERAYTAFAPRSGVPSSVDLRWGRARAAARLGRLGEAYQLGTALAAADAAEPDYPGLLGVLAAQFGDRGRAQALLERLAVDTAPYSHGRPQFQAGRIAAALGEVKEATHLFASALDRGYPYDLELHRDQTLAPLRGLPVLRRLDAIH